MPQDPKDSENNKADTLALGMEQKQLQDLADNNLQNINVEEIMNTPWPADSFATLPMAGKENIAPTNPNIGNDKQDSSKPKLGRAEGLYKKFQTQLEQIKKTVEQIQKAPKKSEPNKKTPGKPKNKS